MHAYKVVYKSTSPASSILFHGIKYETFVERETEEAKTIQKRNIRKKEIKEEQTMPFQYQFFYYYARFIYSYTQLPLYTLVVCPTENGAFPFRIKDNI